MGYKYRNDGTPDFMGDTSDNISGSGMNVANHGGNVDMNSGSNYINSIVNSGFKNTNKQAIDGTVISAVKQGEGLIKKGIAVAKLYFSGGTDGE